MSEGVAAQPAQVHEGYEVTLASGRSVKFVKAKAADTHRIYGLADLNETDVSFVAGMKVAESGLKLTIREVDGKPVDYAYLRDQWNALWDFGELRELVEHWNVVHFGGGKGKLKAVTFTA